MHRKAGFDCTACVGVILKGLPPNANPSPPEVSSPEAFEVSCKGGGWEGVGYDGIQVWGPLSSPPIISGWDERKVCATGPALPNTLLPPRPGSPPGWGLWDHLWPSLFGMGKVPAQPPTSASPTQLAAPDNHSPPAPWAWILGVN